MIVGYGPVGATLALLLARGGLKVAVVDQSLEVFPKPRAIGADHEFMRAMQFCGVADEVGAAIFPYQGSVYLGVDGEPIRVFDGAKPPFALAWPFVFSFVQPEIDGILRAKAASTPNIETFLGWRLTSLDAARGSILIESCACESPKTKALKGRYVLACDGASSTARRMLDIELEDLNFDQMWLVVDALLERPVELPKTNIQYCNPYRPATFVIGPRNLRRWEIKVRPEETAEHFESMTNVESVLSNYVDTSALKLWRAAVYRFHALVARTWRTNRVFLVGDAAHQTPPFLGQGLCTGIRDAMNLAWKILLVEQGKIDAQVLGTYEAERRPHSKTVIEAAKELGLIVGQTDEAEALARDERLREIMAAGTDVRQRLRLIPPLSEGVIGRDDNGAPSSCAGDLFIQPMVNGEGAPQRFDDLVGMDFVILTTTTELQAAVDRENIEFWRLIGGRRIVIGAKKSAIVCSGDVENYNETSDVFASWMAERACEAVIVRPDRYVYAVANTARELNSALASLRELLWPAGR